MRARRVDAGSVVVVTGASSGIGRASALAFAGLKARLVLVARERAPLEEVATLCRARGAEVLVQALDVTDAAAVDAMAQAAVATFGGIDIWLNCAAVLQFGRFETVPEADFRRVIDINFFGYVNGARAALGAFRRQGGHGTLINIASVLGRIGEPQASAYVASRFAVRGWSACLRQELADTPGISVCTVLPAPFDTPIYQKASNHSGLVPRAIFPVGDPQDVAAAIVKLARRPRREYVVGWFGRLLVLGDLLLPGVLERLIARVAPRLQFTGEAAQATRGNIWSATGPHAATGGWRDYWRARMSGSAKARD